MLGNNTAAGTAPAPDEAAAAVDDVDDDAGDDVDPCALPHRPPATRNMKRSEAATGAAAEQSCDQTNRHLVGLMVLRLYNEAAGYCCFV